jgi:hypothetical protein
VEPLLVGNENSKWQGRLKAMKRAGISLVAAMLLVGCAQIAVKQAAGDAMNCVKTARGTPEGQIVFARLWVGDGSDNADKLVDPKPLTKDERNALLQYHNQVQACRQIVIAHDNRYAAWETPYWQELFQRSDAITFKLASGEIPVGVANRLGIESKVDVSRAHADAVRVEEAQRQRAAEAMLQASTQLVASQPKMTTTNCTWLGNSLNCTSFH